MKKLAKFLLTTAATLVAAATVKAATVVGPISTVFYKDEGVTVSTSPNTIDFVGSGVTVTKTGVSSMTVTITGGGGGGASSLEVFNNNDATRSSPTASISLSNAFRGTVSGSTYTFRINFSSVVSQSDLSNYLTNSSATATYFNKLSPHVSSINATSPVTVTANGTAGATPTIALTQNGGTDITADLEEETHATEHQDGGADEISVTGLAGLLVDRQKIAVSTGGTLVAVSSGVNLSAGSGLVLSGSAGSNGFTNLSVSVDPSATNFVLIDPASPPQSGAFSVSGGTITGVLTIDESGNSEIERVNATSGFVSRFRMYYSVGTPVIGFGYFSPGLFGGSGRLSIFSDAGAAVSSWNNAGDFQNGGNLEFSGRFGPSFPVKISTSTTLTKSNYFVQADASNRNIVITLPDADSITTPQISHYQLSVCRTDNSTHSVTFAAGAVEDFAPDYSDLRFKGECIILISSCSLGGDTGTWHTLSKTSPHAPTMLPASETLHYAVWRASDVMTSNAQFYVPPSTTSAAVGRVWKVVNIDGEKVYFDFASDSTGGGGSGTTIQVEEGGSTVVNTSTVDFHTGLDVADNGGEARVTVDLTEASGFTADPQQIRFSTGGTQVAISSGINFIEGSGIQYTATETGNRFDLTIAATLGTSISAAEIADGDHGDFTYTSGVAAIDANAVALGTDSTGIYVASLTVTSPITLSGTNNVETAAPILSLNQNGGTDVTADLEEETHASEHQDGGADEISVTGLSGLLADRQKIQISTGGTEVAISSGINFIAGTNVTLSGAYSSANGRVDITINSSGGGGGGSSTLAVGTGTASNFTTNVTSPTAAISFLGTQFRSVAGGTTNFISLADGFSYTFNAEQAKLGSPFSTSNGQISNSTSALTGSVLLDDSTDEAVIWSTTLTGYYGGTLKADVYYSMVSATSGKVDLEVSLMCVSPDDSADLDSSSFASAGNNNETVPGTAGYMSTLTITPTDDSCANGDIIIVALNRDANDGTNDTASGDLEIRKVRLYE